jgi:hypothetical protein
MFYIFRIEFNMSFHLVEAMHRCLTYTGTVLTCVVAGRWRSRANRNANADGIIWQWPYAWRTRRLRQLEPTDDWYARVP